MKNEKIEEVAEQVFMISAERPGPTVAIVGGVHGNEKTGIAVVSELLAEARRGELRLKLGRLLLAFGNPHAIERGTRGSIEGADLNRSFRQAVLDGEGTSYEEERARDLACAFDAVTIGVDIHATNKPSEPFLCAQRIVSAEHRDLCAVFCVERVLLDPAMVFAGETVTLDEYFARQGRIGICYETGQASDLARVQIVKNEVRELLRRVRMIDGFSQQSHGSRSQIFYALSHAITLTSAGFIYAPGMGNENFQPFEAGMLIGHHGSEPFVAAYAGVIVFPKIASLWSLGQPVGYLAKRL